MEKNEREEGEGGGRGGGGKGKGRKMRRKEGGFDHWSRFFFFFLSPDFRSGARELYHWNPQLSLVLRPLSFRFAYATPNERINHFWQRVKNEENDIFERPLHSLRTFEWTENEHYAYLEYPDSENGQKSPSKEFFSQVIGPPKWRKMTKIHIFLIVEPYWEIFRVCVIYHSKGHSILNNMPQHNFSCTPISGQNIDQNAKK